MLSETDWALLDANIRDTMMDEPPENDEDWSGHPDWDYRVAAIISQMRKSERSGKRYSDDQNKLTDEFIARYEKTYHVKFIPRVQ